MFSELTEKEKKRIQKLEAQIQEQKTIVKDAEKSIDSMEKKIDKIRFSDVGKLETYNQLAMLPRNLISIQVNRYDSSDRGLVIEIAKNIFLCDKCDYYYKGQYSEWISYKTNIQAGNRYEHIKCKELTSRYQPETDVHKVNEDYLPYVSANSTLRTELVFECSDELTDKIIKLFDLAKEDTWEDSILKAYELLKIDGILRPNKFADYYTKSDFMSYHTAFENALKYYNEHELKDEIKRVTDALKPIKED